MEEIKRARSPYINQTEAFWTLFFWVFTEAFYGGFITWAYLIKSLYIVNWIQSRSCFPFLNVCMHEHMCQAELEVPTFWSHGSIDNQFSILKLSKGFLNKLINNRKDTLIALITGNTKALRAMSQKHGQRPNVLREIYFL